VTELHVIEGRQVPQGNRFKRTWTPEKVIAAVRRWADEYGAPPTSTEWEIGKPAKYAQAALDKAQLWHEKAARFESGEFPGNDTCRRFFGTFNAAMAAAGFEPRPEGRTPRELTDRQLRALRKRRGGLQAGPSQLAAQIRSVMEARAAKDNMCLKAALYDLAATAMAWCESIDVKDEAA
jgi:hypothetical protein